ncbi:hypothetical protein UYSO10_2755 [Kosakonia radicincitans]|nr:hypothetical protein UYSO10_2755 [Kosakonia radicincitans]
MVSKLPHFIAIPPCFNQPVKTGTFFSAINSPQLRYIA